MGESTFRYKQNRFQQLRGFCFAVAAGGISKAAKRMNLSQPSVSQQIRSLESELGVVLFRRRGARLELTPDGELLFKISMPLVERLEAVLDEFEEQRQQSDEGYIDVAAGGSTIYYVLPQYVETFRRAYPGISVRLHSVTGTEGLARLRSGSVDLAVGPLLEVPDDIDFFPILSYEPVVISCLGHPLARKAALSLEEISRYPLILPPREQSTWRVVDSTFKTHGLKYHVAMEVGGWDLIKKYVELGLGISIISSIGITGQEKLEVMPAGAFFPKRTYGVVMLKGRRLRLHAQRFFDLLLPGAAAA